MVLRDRDTDGNGTLDERLWVQQDANFNVTALVNGSGAVVERYVYDPYGAVTIYDASYSTVRSSSSYAWVNFHQGLRLDATAALYDNYGRWYSPSLGRFISVDPLGLAPDVNDYRYVGNDPTGVLDPSGLEPPERTCLNCIGVVPWQPRPSNYAQPIWGPFYGPVPHHDQQRRIDLMTGRVPNEMTPEERERMAMLGFPVPMPFPASSAKAATDSPDPRQIGIVPLTRAQRRQQEEGQFVFINLAFTLAGMGWGRSFRFLQYVGPAANPSVADAIAHARRVAGGAAGDCEAASVALGKQLTGGRVVRLPVGRVGQHQVYVYNGRILDATAGQYTRNPAVLKRIEEAGLRSAVENGEFTVEQHIRFMEIVRGGRFSRGDYFLP
jgi:RHS repeat-associated protein